MNTKIKETTATDYESFGNDDFSDVMAYYCKYILNIYPIYCNRLRAKYIEKVIFNDPATIVIWGDGSKTIVRCAEDDVFDPEKGLAMAITKRALGGNYKKCFEEWLPKPELQNFIETIDNTLNKKD